MFKRFYFQGLSYINHLSLFFISICLYTCFKYSTGFSAHLLYIFTIETFNRLVNSLLWLKGDLTSVHLFIVLHFLPSWSEGVDTGVGWLVGTALGVVGLKVVVVSAVPFPAAETLPKIMNMNTSAIFILKNILFSSRCHLKVQWWFDV